MGRLAPQSYDVIRLHSRSENAWAVIEMPSGAIALDAETRLLMRMLRRDALQMAERLNFAATSGQLLDRAAGLQDLVSRKSASVTAREP